MTSVWRLPTVAEKKIGYVAMCQRKAWCYIEKLHKSILVETDSEGNLMWLGYREVMLERRHKRGADVPTWYQETVAPKIITMPSKAEQDLLWLDAQIAKLAG